jgi:hypothetical protein
MPRRLIGAKVSGDPGAPRLSQELSFSSLFGTPDWHSTFTNLVGITLWKIEKAR